MNPMRLRDLVAGFALTLAACSSLPYNAVPPRVGVADVEVKSLGLFEQTFDVGLRVSNPNDFDITIEGLDFTLEVNGRPFASGVSQVSVRVPAVASAVLRVDAVMESKNLIRQLKTLPPATLAEGVPYRIKGRVKVDKASGWLPFDHAGVYGGEAKKPKGRAI
jgi:LEA14-like dessication related protein